MSTCDRACEAGLSHARRSNKGDDWGTGVWTPQSAHCKVLYDAPLHLSADVATPRSAGPHCNSIDSMCAGCGHTHQP